MALLLPLFVETIRIRLTIAAGLIIIFQEQQAKEPRCFSG
jgi:hypothetical protein